MAKLAINGGRPVRGNPFPAYPVFGPAVEEAVLRVARSNMYCSANGTEVRKFENEFAGYHGAAHAVAVTNGTLSLQVAVGAAGIGVGDEVIVPAYTYIATASAVVAQNAVPVFVDCETISEGADPSEIGKKITPRTRAIMPVHMNGYPCDMDSIMSIARKHSLIVIEDCSHAHGALYQGRKVGTIGDIGAFSLQHKKIVSVGEGGVSITNNDGLAKRMRDLRDLADVGMTNNWRLSEFHGAIGQVQLERLDERNAVRRENAAYLKSRLASLPGLSLLEGHAGTAPVYYNFIALYSEEELGVPRKRFVEAMAAEGVPMSMFYIPLNRHEIFKEANAFGKGCPFACPLYGGKVAYSEESYPNAERFCYRSNLELKIHPPRGKSDMSDVADAFEKVLENIGELK